MIIFIFTVLVILDSTAAAHTVHLPNDQMSNEHTSEIRIPAIQLPLHPSLLALGKLPPCAAVIVEPRVSAVLVDVVQAAVANLPNTWPVYVYHSTQNEQLVRDGLQSHIDSVSGLHTRL